MQFILNDQFRWEKGWDSHGWICRGKSPFRIMTTPTFPLVVHAFGQGDGNLENPIARIDHRSGDFRPAVEIAGEMHGFGLGIHAGCVE